MISLSNCTRWAIVKNSYLLLWSGILLINAQEARVSVLSALKPIIKANSKRTRLWKFIFMERGKDWNYECNPYLYKESVVNFEAINVATIRIIVQCQYLNSIYALLCNAKFKWFSHTNVTRTVAISICYLPNKYTCKLC